jgi:hypothetical protein
VRARALFDDMTPRVKYALSIVAAYAVAIVLLMLLLGRVLTRIIPTGEDAEISDKIRTEFEDAITTNQPPGKRPLVISSPRRNATEIIVKGEALTDGEKQGLRAVAEGIGLRNANRPIELHFQTVTNSEAIIRP